MLRTTLFAFATCFATSAAALCSGDSYDARLTPEQAATLDATTAATPFGTGIIWELVKDETEITLIGTVHISDPRLDDVRAAVGDRVTSADLLMVEVTPDEERDMTRAFTTDPSIYLLTDGPTLPDILTPETWEAVSQAASDRQIPPFMVAQFQPWYLSLTLGMPPCAVAELAAGVRGLDHMLMADAEEAGVPLARLEDWEGLIALLSDGDMATQIEMLELSLLPPQIIAETTASLLNDYFAGNTARLTELSRVIAGDLTGLPQTEAEALFDEMLGPLLTQRNHNWLPVIKQAATTHDRLAIAVGAAHLPGDEGLLSLLSADGWTATQIR